MRWAALPLPVPVPVPVLVLVLVAACAAEQSPEPAPTPRATVAAPRTLVAADFDPAMLGAHVADMESTDVETGDGLARVSAFVACPRAMATCDPATTPEGTMFTYVVTITPQAEDAPETAPPPSPSPSASEPSIEPVEVPAELVRMTRAAHGFEGAVGFSRAEAAAALGAEDALTVTLDQKQLIWRVTGGSGWQPGKPITLWWQSGRAPAKPAPAYRLEWNGKSADIAAPFPGAEKPVERNR